MADLTAKEKEAAEKIAALTTAHNQAATQLQQQLEETNRSLEQTRAEKQEAVTDLAAREKEAADKIAALTATHNQAAAELQQQLAETNRSLEQTRTEKQEAVAALGADKQKLALQMTKASAERDALKQQIEGKLVLDPYWQWIFGAVVGLGALGWGSRWFRP